MTGDTCAANTFTRCLSKRIRPHRIHLPDTVNASNSFVGPGQLPLPCHLRQDLDDIYWIQEYIYSMQSMHRKPSLDTVKVSNVFTR